MSTKSGKSSKSTPASSSAKATSKSSKEQKNQRVGSDLFHFPNGDEYEGEFFAKASSNHKDFSIYKEGCGLYRTVDGHTYRSNWVRDVIPNDLPLDVDFPDGAHYSGLHKNMLYNENGIYTFRDGSRLECCWKENRPLMDPIPVIIDHNDNCWHALPEVQQSERDLTFVIVNRFLPMNPPSTEDLQSESQETSVTGTTGNTSKRESLAR